VKILFVSHWSPIPCDTSNRAHTLNMIRELVRWGHEIHYAVLNSDASIADQLTELELDLGGGRAHEIEIRKPHQLESMFARGWRRFLRVIRHKAGFRLPLDFYYDSRATNHLRALHDVTHFGAVIAEYVSASRALEAFDPKVFRILDTQGTFGDRHRKVPRAGRGHGWYATSLREEERGFRRADLVLAVHRGEGKRFKRRLAKDGERVRTVSHFLDLSRRIEPKGNPAAAFVGSLNEANVAGLRFLVRQVMPRVLEHRPEFNLLVAGPISERVKPQKAVEACGFVQHVADVYTRAPLALNPITLSGGFSIRVPEAMACGVPSISTQTGVYGVGQDFLRGVRVVRDGDPGAFAAAILDILEDPAKSRRMGADAYAAAAAWNQQQRSSLREVIELASLFHVGAYRRPS
jgi:polysaccharide biosynthesis protein PslH